MFAQPCRQTYEGASSESAQLVESIGCPFVVSALERLFRLDEQ
jgi:hypothetical protein